MTIDRLHRAIENSNKSKDWWFSPQHQLQYTFLLANELYYNYDQPGKDTYKKCIDEARMMVNTFYSTEITKTHRS